jgi:tetratricopeptide (TPR) repeat protein
LSRRNCPAALGIADTPDADPIASARTAFGQGLFRRGIAILNQALQENMGPVDAWLLKSRFLHSIGFDRAAVEMVDGALARHAAATNRIALLEEQSFLWAEGNHGERALQSADAAAALGSNSVRTHYLRGRALALLGQLRDARCELLEVLKLDPDNADAHRALPVIDAAIRPEVTKPWWRFWQ